MFKGLRRAGLRPAPMSLGMRGDAPA